MLLRTAILFFNAGLWPALFAGERPRFCRCILTSDPGLMRTVHNLESEPQRQLPFRKVLPSPSARPFLKWAGGKTQLLAQFERFYPQKPIKRYIEPFVGSGAVFFDVKARLNPETAILCDNNQDLIRTFRAVKTKVEAVIRALREHKAKHNLDHYQAMRTKATDNDVDCAARLIYLNKTCFNGLYRVNSKGIFNVPMGRYPKPSILDEDAMRAASRALKGVTLVRRDFRTLPRIAKPGDFIYFDPPYYPVSDTSYFTSYTRDSFGAQDHWDLAQVYAELIQMGCYVMLSNSANPFIDGLYWRFRKDASIHRVSANRRINSRADRRGLVDEIVVVNYPVPEK
jgi:DNA adenine methylase